MAGWLSLDPLCADSTVLTKVKLFLVLFYYAPDTFPICLQNFNNFFFV